MRVPEALEPLLDQGMIDEVIRPLMAGKEAQIYLVSSQGHRCVAKVYKDASTRSFKQRADYTEGRKTRNSRSERAMAKKSRFGKAEIEQAWRSAEVDALYKLRDAGVHVPEPYAFVDGVLLMELVVGPEGEPAPRLADVHLTEDEARWVLDQLIGDIIRMLCAGVVHGDLSDFNVLIGPHGPVIIDFPQAVDPAHNNNAGRLLVRDVKNVVSFMARFVPDVKDLPLGEEMWDLYERGLLRPDSLLTGTFKPKKARTNVASILAEIEASEQEARARREALGLPPPRTRAPVVKGGPAPRPVDAKGRSKGERADDARRGGGRDGAARSGRDDRGDRAERAGRPDRSDRSDRSDRVRRDDGSAERPARGGHDHRRSRDAGGPRREPPPGHVDDAPAPSRQRGRRPLDDDHDPLDDFLVEG